MMYVSTSRWGTSIGKSCPSSEYYGIYDVYGTFTSRMNESLIKIYQKAPLFAKQSLFEVIARTMVRRPETRTNRYRDTILDVQASLLASRLILP